MLADLDGADERLAAFARSYARRMGIDQLERPAPTALAAQIRSLFAFVDGRRGEIAVRALNPTVAEEGYTAAGTVVEANLPDSPFLIDSVGEELRSRGLEVRAVVHPVMGIERADDGSIVSVGPARGALHRESVMHFEVSRRVPGDQLAGLEEGVARVLADVRLVVRDFHSMVDRVDRMVELAHEAAGRYGKDDIAEAISFLHWLKADNFVFLGYREYELHGSGGDRSVQAAPGSGLGILSDTSLSGYAQPVALSALKPTLRDRVVDGPLVTVSKTNRQATVHRRVKMDYVGVKRVDESGNVVG